MNALPIRRRTLGALLAATLLAACATPPATEARPPIVFVHGNGDTAALWTPTIWRWQSNGWPRERLHAIDFPLPSARDDFFAVTDDGDLIAANGNQLLFYRRAEEKWIELAKFSEPGLQHITRIAFSPSGNSLALVGDEPAPPRP